MTTDRTPRLAGLSVRTRITAAVALLTALALAAAGLSVWALESARIERSMNGQIEQEVAEFRNLQNGTDPATGKPFTSVEALIRLFLQRNVPDDDEALIGYWDGSTRVSSESPHEEFGRSPELLASVARRLRSGGSERLETEHGQVVITVVPTRNSATAGALVVVNFLSDEYGELTQTLQTYTVVSTLLLLLVTGAAAWQAGRLLSPLRTLREAAQAISETDLSRRIPETGNDDITALTRTFNQMLERLDRAFSGQRRFLDDAGHELKTPLTVLQGHLELVDLDDPAEVRATRQLLLDETERMGRLVADLTTLAKTDRPDFFRFEPVDVGPFLTGLLEKCRALGPRTWVLDHSVELRTDLDEQRMTQAVLQLAQNAVKHTREGDEIGLGAAVSAERGLELWVRDTGPGVPDEDKERVFERFARSRVPAEDDGFGLGLSIVSAIAVGHGGTVHVGDSPGGGATFTLTLPLRREDDQWPAS
jgi:two-component system OmpR family sensor kinase